MNFTSQQLQDLERKAIDDAHAANIVQAIAVLFEDKDEQKFRDAVDYARQCREFAYNVCGITPRNP